MSPNDKSILDKYLKNVTIRNVITAATFLCGGIYSVMKLYNEIDKRITVMETKQDMFYREVKDEITNMPKCHCSGNGNGNGDTSAIYHSNSFLYGKDRNDFIKIPFTNIRSADPYSRVVCIY